MRLEKSVSRTLIETYVQKAVRCMKRDPERGLRSVVDMALQFSGGRFQKVFFGGVQKLLSDENSAYYGLLKHALAEIDEEHLITYGMNVGYNGCTMGAKRIRENEKKLGFQIPWLVTMKLGARLDAYDQVVAEGENLGIYNWALAAETGAQRCFEWIGRHPDSAFDLFCAPSEVTEDFADGARALKNLMPVVRFEAGADKACARLRRARLPYSVYLRYGVEELEAIVSRKLFEEIQPLHPLLSVFVPKPDCPEAVRQAAARALEQIRDEQSYQTIPWEMVEDTRYVDHVISDEPCSAFIDETGRLCGWDGQIICLGSVFDRSLADRLKAAQGMRTDEIG